MRLPPVPETVVFTDLASPGPPPEMVLKVLRRRISGARDA
jgi:hypothetical protein